VKVFGPVGVTVPVENPVSAAVMLPVPITPPVLMVIVCAEVLQLRLREVVAVAVKLSTTEILTVRVVVFGVAADADVLAAGTEGPVPRTLTVWLAQLPAGGV
jgi:hypothetical protein